MPIRVRKSGKLEWRFTVDGHQYSGVTDLADTERNGIKVGRIEAEKRRLVLEGRASELRLQVQPFSDAADQFIEWAKGEYRDHPNSWKRLSVSMTKFASVFGEMPIMARALSGFRNRIMPAPVSGPRASEPRASRRTAGTPQAPAPPSRPAVRRCDRNNSNPA
jgi:hypothetical protein